MSFSATPGEGQLSKKRKLSLSNIQPNAEDVAFNSIYQRLARSDIWFEDGNVILQTSDKMYRAHRGVLSMHSTVFKDMFGVPQPTDQPRIDGCHIVVLSDSAEDWDEFLPMLYNKRSAFQPRENTAKSYAIPIKLLLAMLVLGHKYDFRVFWDQALHILKICFPENFDEFEEFWFGKVNDDSFANEHIFRHTYRIVHIAIDLGLLTVLPAAYHICMTLPSTDDLLAGIDEPGGPVYLTYQTRHRLILGREWIQEQTLSTIFLWLDIKPPCATMDRCERKFTAWFGNLVAQASFWDFMALDQTSNITRGDLCEMCYRDFQSHFKETRKSIFSRLPGAI